MIYIFEDFKFHWGKKLFCLQYHRMILIRPIILNFNSIGNLTPQLRFKLRISAERLTYFARICRKHYGWSWSWLGLVWFLFLWHILHGVFKELKIIQWSITIYKISRLKCPYILQGCIKARKLAWCYISTLLKYQLMLLWRKWRRTIGPWMAL